jgi:hypothetical protein
MSGTTTATLSSQRKVVLNGMLVILALLDAS